MINSTITVAIITRNRAKLLKRCLNSLLEQTKKPSEILIVDNASSDATKQAALSFVGKLPIRYVFEKKIGVSHARNRALRETKGGIVSFMDDDSEATRTWVERIILAHKQFPKAAAIQGKSISLPRRSILSLITQASTELWHIKNTDEKRYIHFCDTRNVSFKIDILRRLQISFNNAFNKFGKGEDFDFAQQLIAKRQHIVYAETILNYHHERNNLFSSLRQKYAQGRSKAIGEKKWPQYYLKKGFFPTRKLKDNIDAKILSDSSPTTRFMFKTLSKLHSWTFNKGYTDQKKNFSLKEVTTSSLPQNKQISVAIVTRNRARLLKKALHSLSRQTIYPSEVLVIDNGSRDNTKEIVAFFTGVLPLRYIYEKKTGIPYARNRALRETKGEILAFMDDDCETQSQWVEEILKAHKEYPFASAIQGETKYKPENGLFARISYELHMLWFKINMVEGNRLLVCDTKNLSLRMPSIRRLHTVFNTSLVRGSDVDFGKQLVAKNQHIMYQPKIVNFHWERDNITTYLQQKYYQGRSKARIEISWSMDEFYQYTKDIPTIRETQARMESNLPFLNKLLLRTIFHMQDWIFAKGYQDERKKQWAINEQILRSGLGRMNSFSKSLRQDNISVLIVTKNRPQQLGRCLLSLVRQTILPKEIIIVDSSPENKTRKSLTPFQKFLPIRYFFEPKGGISAARNLAMHKAKGKLMAFIDDDCEATPTWIEEMVKAHERNPAAIAIVGQTRIFPDTGLVSYVSQQSYNLWVNVNLKDNNELLTLDAENSSFKRKPLLKLGVSFDELFRKFYYCEDLDFAYQLLFYKQRIIYYPQAIIRSWRRKNAFIYFKQQFQKGLGEALTDYKWFKAITPNGIWLQGRRIPYGENASQIKELYRWRYKNKLHYYNRQFLLLPSINIFESIAKPVMEIIHHYVYKYGLFFGSRMLPKGLLHKVQNISKTRSITVAIITHDRTKAVRRLLASLIAQTILPTKILIINNGSNDSTRDLAEEFKAYLPIRYIYETRTDTPTAYNRAIKEAKGEILAFIGDDCEAGKVWIEEMIKGHKEYPNAVAIQGLSTSMKKKSFLSIALGAFYPLWLRRNTIIDPSLVVLDTKNVSFKLPVVKKLGVGFESSFSWGSDVDFAKQLREKGGKIAYVRQAVISYRGTNIVTSLRHAKGIGSSQAKLAFKWQGRIPQQRKTIQKEFENAVKDIAFSYPPFQRWIISFFATLYLFIYKRSFEKTSKNYLGLKPLLPAFAKRRLFPLTVAIVTRNRAMLLKQCLSSLSKQAVTPREVLVIDNGSTDETKDIANLFSNLLPIRYIHEPTIGIPHARNRALTEARGEIIAFIDDDCEAASKWLERVEKAHRNSPTALAIQGQTTSKPKKSIFAVMWEHLYNLWLTKNTVDQNQLLVLDTKNVSFKIDPLRSLDLSFNVAFDRGSDVDFAKQILAKNQSIIFDPKVHAYHWERGNLVNFLKQKYMSSKAMAKIDYIWPSYLFPQQKNSFTVTFDEVSFLRRLLLRLVFILSENIFKIGYKRTKNGLFHELTYPPYFSFLNTKKAANISVVIVTWNRALLLKKCLMSLTKQSLLPTEVLIIQRPSNDNTTAVIDSFSKILPIRNVIEKRPGVAQARNKALEEAKNDILAFFDDDCELNSTWVEEVVNAHTKFPTAAVIQGKSHVLNKQSIFGILAHKYKNDWTDKNIINENELKVFESQGSSLKKGLIKKLGLRFDSSISEQFYYGDDADLSAALNAHNQKIIFEPKIEVFFKPRDTLTSFLKQRFLFGMTNTFLAYKWGQGLYAHTNRTIDPTKNLLPMRWYHKRLYPIVAYLSKHAYYFGTIIEGISLYVDFSRLYRSPSLPQTNKDHVRLSVMIITKDRPKLLQHTLTSLTKQSRIPDEIILVDSSEESVYPSILKFEKHLPIKYIYEERLGFGVARNTGLKNATGDIIATIDDDEEAPSDWCKEIVAAHIQFPKAAAIQGRLICKPTSPYAIVEQIRLNRWFLHSLKYDNTIWALSTKNVSLKKAIIKKVHLKFATNPLYGKSGGEDVDFGNQILSQKLSIVYVPSIAVYHTERPNVYAYFKQQYRKGNARTLIKNDWKELEDKKSSFAPAFYNQVMDLFIHPLARKNFFFIPLFLLTYFPSVYVYKRGMADMHRLLQKRLLAPQLPKIENIPIRQKAASFTVVIIARNHAKSIYNTLVSMAGQTLFPTRILILDNGSRDDTEAIAYAFKPLLPIDYMYETRTGSIAYARGRAVKEAKTSLLAFIDDDSEADSTWIENIVKAHRKYPNASIIQGRFVSKPKNSPYSVVAQFNRQTWIRDNMLGDRNLYWKWVSGNLKGDFAILVCDTRNMSIKVKRIRAFEEVLRGTSDSEFAKTLLANGESIIFYPPALAYHYERSLSFLQYQWDQRKIAARIASFVYFCLKNKHYADIPLLTSIFLLQKMVLTYGKISGNRNVERV